MSKESRAEYLNQAAVRNFHQMTPDPHPRLILASTSPYRRALLARLKIPFEVMDPNTPETPLANEAPDSRALRLAEEKAAAIACEGVLIIGSDQVACIDSEILRKPGTPKRAAEQLRRCSGKSVTFWTAVALRNTRSGSVLSRLTPAKVTFRHLSDREIGRYVEVDQPLDCAGSFKWESLGISLFSSIESDDPTSLEGLPLIAVCDLLRDSGLALPLLSQ